MFDRTEIPVTATGVSAWEVAKDVSKSAGEILMKWWPETKVISEKGSNDIVTNVDIEAEKFISEKLKTAFPDHGIYGEEAAGDDPEQGWVWVIDPVDGTRNYASGIPFFSLVLALVKDGEVVVGVNYDPLNGEMFHAASGMGAFLNEERMRVSDKGTLDGAMVGIDIAYSNDSGTEDTFQSVRKLWHRLGTVRLLGSSALGISYVAAGRTDIYFHHRLQPYDQAAGLLLVEEAGGVITDRNGIRAGLYSDGIIAASTRTHVDFMNSTKNHGWRRPSSREANPFEI